MPLITWTEALRVGVDSVDTDHKFLISLINQLDEAIEADQDRDVVGSVLNALLDYTVYHFRREEALMDACAYPELDQHRRAHAQLTDRVRAIRADYLNRPDGVVGADVLAFLKDWLTQHILGTDMEYRPYLHGQPDAVAEADRAYAEQAARDMAEAGDAEEVFGDSL